MYARVKWYGTARWQRRAKLQLTLEPLCAICARKGMVVAAEVADHIVPHKGNESEFCSARCNRCASLATTASSSKRSAAVLHAKSASMGFR